MVLAPLKLLVGLFGVVATIAPRAVVAVFTRLAYRGRTDGEPRRWLVVATRLEGAALAGLVIVSLYREASGDSASGSSTAGSASDQSTRERPRRAVLPFAD